MTRMTRPTIPATAPRAAVSTPQSGPCCSLSTRPYTPPEASDLAERFRILSDPTRLRMLSLIASRGCGPVCVGDLVDPLGVSQPTVSHHLRILTDAGLLTRRREGRSVLYTVVAEAFAPLRAALAIG